MKFKKLFLYFSVITLLILFITFGAFYFFTIEKNKMMEEITNVYHNNSTSLIADKVIEDLLIDNQLEANRKLNLLKENGILKNYQFGKVKESVISEYDNCEKIYFDKHNKGPVWGELCLNYTDVYKQRSKVSLAGISLVIIFLIFLILATFLLTLKLILKSNDKLYVGIELVLKNDSDFQFEDSFWEPVLRELRNLVKSNSESEKKLLDQKIITEKNILATKVAHDIKSPLATLNVIANEAEILQLKEAELFKRAILRINEIADSLLKPTEHFKMHNEPSFSNCAILVSEIIEEKNIEFLQKVHFETNFQNVENSYFISSELKRIISNLLNNAFESIEDINPIIKLSIEQKNLDIKITIKDNGMGIPPHVLAKLGKEEISSKSKGNGIGFKHAMEVLKEWNGDLRILETGLDGTTVQIVLMAEREQVAAELKIKQKIVLIDDDELTRTTWEMKARKAGINFKCYKDTETFMEEIESVSKDDILYIDSELGNIKGEMLAEELHNLGFRNISMASGHPPEHFAQYTFLKSVISKKAPF